MTSSSQRDLASTLWLLLFVGLELLVHISPLVTAATANTAFNPSSTDPTPPPPPQRQSLPLQQQFQQHNLRARDHQARDYYVIQVEPPLDPSHKSSAGYSLNEYVHPSFDLHHHHHHRHHVHSDLQDYAAIATSEAAAAAAERDVEPWIEAAVDQARTIGLMLGLDYESRVGSLLDYFLFSRPKPEFALLSDEHEDNNGIPPLLPPPLSSLLPQQERARLAKRELPLCDGSMNAVESKGVKDGKVGEQGPGVTWRGDESVTVAGMRAAGEEAGVTGAAHSNSHSNSHAQGQGQDQGQGQQRPWTFLDYDNGATDPIVQRFHVLKEQYASPLSSAPTSQPKSRHSSDRFANRDPMEAAVQNMKAIQRQELRWRLKKRVPVPDPLPPPIVPEVQDKGKGKGRGRKKVMKEGGGHEDDAGAAGGGQNSEDQPDENDAEEEQDGGGGEDEEGEEAGVAVGDDEGEGEGEGVFEDESDRTSEQQERPPSIMDQGQESGEGSGQDSGEGESSSKVEGQELSNDDEGQPTGELEPDDGLAEYLNITDPGFKYQWHLRNINVTGVWEQNINGTGVNVAIIDDGLDANSEDLKENFFAAGSWDFNDHTAIPLPRLDDDLHGTRCAGEIAAVRNDLCGVGVAYGAKVAGLRILSGQITDVDEAAALNYMFQDNHIYSCSWGPPDDGQSMDGPKGVVMDAIVNGVTYGRRGQGSIFVFATGNGGSQGDDCNFDGYTNSLYTVSIGAIDRHGRHPYYSEACSAQLAVTYSNGGGSAIYTCDVGKRKCYAYHGGTSAAAPIAAGMIALVLSARPDLSWRDVQALLVQTAQPVSIDDEDWKPTAAGRLFNHKFGYGRLDAYALVEAAKSFQNLGPQVSIESPVVVVQKAIPQDVRGVLSTFEVKSTNLAPEEPETSTAIRLGKLEHITVTVNIAHERRGDVEVTLISPLGIESHLGVPRLLDRSKDGFVDWTFMTVKHWGENIVGKWTLRVRDNVNPSYRGTFINWRIKFWGEVEHPQQQNQDEGQETILLYGGGDNGEAHGDGEEGGNRGADNSQKEPEQELFEEGPAEETETLTATSDETSKNENGDSPTPDPKSGSPEEGEGDSSNSPDFFPPSSSTNHENESGMDNLMEAIADPEDGSVANTQDEEVVASRAGHALVIFGSIISVAGCASLLLYSKRRWDGRGRYSSVSNTDRDHLSSGGAAGGLSLLPRTNADAASNRQGMAAREAPTSGGRSEPGTGRGTALSKVLRGAVGRMSSQARIGAHEDKYEPSTRLVRELLDPLESSPTEEKEVGVGDVHDDEERGGSDTDSEDDWMGGGR
ncbi:pheromone processing endoprotease [Actinomortierella ambigua]|nr:pheromone processing endoprotease [Actinomortierella ambigua]